MEAEGENLSARVNGALREDAERQRRMRGLRLAARPPRRGAWADTANPLYGALAFTLQSLGNLAVVALVLAAEISMGRGALPRWLAARPGRAAITAAGLLIAGAFTVIY